MHLIYIDDSRDEKLCVFSALAIPIERWRANFQKIREFRRELKRSDGIYVYKELHAWKLVSGRGNISEKIVTKYRRCQIFREAVGLVAQLEGARLFNAVFPRKQQDRAFEYMVNRINRALEAWESHGILFCDEGNDNTITKLIRKMGVYNPIPSQFGAWQDTGQSTRNIPIDRIVEDPVFKKSERSYFIQLVDMVAYALLRRERQIPSKNKYDIHKVFDAVSGILVTAANKRDTEGIIRP